jgi:mycothiol synthase
MEIIAPARPADWNAALELALAGLAADERRLQVSNILALLHGGELDPAGIWVARAAGAIVGVVVCELLGGAAGILWKPMVRNDRGPQLAVRLVQAGLAWCNGRGCKLIQALLPPADADHAGPLCAAGFRYVTELQLLQHDLEGLAAPPAGLRLVPSTECRAELFAEVLVRTYRDSLDCPELNGVRSVAEILAGHRAAGKDRPDLWWLACAGQEPVGILLLTELAHGFDWDLSYLGVVPEARGRGLGRALARHALAVARAWGAQHLLLAVDQRNRPAEQIYRSLGFRTREVRLVYLHFPVAPSVAGAAGR